MPRKKTTTDKVEKLVGTTLRLNEQDSRLFNALLSLRGESANDVLKKTALDYIKKYQHLLNMEEIQKIEESGKPLLGVFKKGQEKE